MKQSQVECKLNMMLANEVDIGIIAAISLMFQSGCRISSILQLSYRDVSPSGRIVLKQGKGSEPMVVVPCDFKEWWQHFRNTRSQYYELQNYTFYYRLFQKYRLTMPNQFGTKNAITATARKMVAQDTLQISGDIHIAQIALGHKSVNSTQFYVQKKAKKNE